MTEIIDDMMGLYRSARQAVGSGERMGADDLFRAVIDAVRTISVEFEMMPHDDAMATQGFKVAQQCAGAICRVKEALDARQGREKEMIEHRLNGGAFQ